MKQIIYLYLLACLLLPITSHAEANNIELSVWANEAIVSTYTFDYNNFINQQKTIAKYFTVDGWTQYIKALNDSKLPQTIQKNAYSVTAVATMPPVIKSVGKRQWIASMPLLVVYSNPQYQQKQTLQVSILFTAMPAGQGVRGLAIMSLQSKVSKPPCVCKPQHEEATPSSNANTSGANAGQLDLLTKKL